MKEVDPSHTEYRDDRFVAAFDRASNQSRSSRRLSCARRAGKYVYRRDRRRMYRPERFGRTAFARSRSSQMNAERVVAIAGALIFALGLAIPAAWSISQNLEPIDLNVDAAGMTIVVDRDGRLLRLPPRSLASAVEAGEVILAISRCFWPTRMRVLRPRQASMAPLGAPVCSSPPAGASFRRLDADDASPRLIDRARREALRRNCASSPGLADRARSQDGVLIAISPGALRGISRGSRRIGLFRKEPRRYDSRSRAARRPAAIA